MRASISEYKAVEEAAMKFVKSVAEGNSRYAKELFTDEAVLFGFLDGKLEHGSIIRIQIQSRNNSSVKILWGGACLACISFLFGIICC